MITPTPAGNVSNSTIVSNSTALPTDAPTTTASLTRTCALCTSQNVEECTINSTHTGSNVSLVECPAISHCFTSTFADNTSQVTILFRGCSSMPSYGSHCGNVTSSGSLLSYCSCYCDQSNCSTVTNSCLSHSVLLSSFVRNLRFPLSGLCQSRMPVRCFDDNAACAINSCSKYNSPYSNYNSLCRVW